MIQIELSKKDFENDIRSLVMAFYPGEQITNKEILNPEDSVNPQDYMKIKTVFEEDSIGISFLKNGVPILENSITLNDSSHMERIVYKNQLKKLVYRSLCTITGKTLPWGTLTGIRPTKIALKGLENKCSKEEIETNFKSEYLCSDEKTNLCLSIAKRELTILEKIDYKNGYSIYIGIPFCPTTCLYCSFTSYSIAKYSSYVDSYLQALYKEIEYAGTCFPNKKLTSIYIGGGTPTTLDANQLDRLLTNIEDTFDFTYLKEFTVEAGRPDSITAEKLKVLKKHDVTRISINPQTMNQNTLDIIGRKHSVKQVVEAFHLARELGHDNINMDLIIGLPGENLDCVNTTLEEIDKLNPDSLTVHTLAIKRAAYLNIYKERYAGMMEYDTKAMLLRTSQYAKSKGYVPYYLYRQKNMSENLENIGYSYEGKEAIYNILIMEERQTILALGAGSSSKFVFPGGDRIERVENVKDVKEYVERIDEMILRKKQFIEGEFNG